MGSGDQSSDRAPTFLGRAAIHDTVGPALLVALAVQAYTVCRDLPAVKAFPFMLPSNESEVRGEYWLFMGQILGILGALVTNTLSYYFGSSDAKDK